MCNTDMTERSYAKSIRLPTENVFRNLKTARRFAVDVGGSLAKLAYTATVQRKTSLVSEDGEDDGNIYRVSDTDQTIVQLHFVKFETRLFETCLDFIQDNLKVSNKRLQEKCIKVTGGGGYKYSNLITAKLGVQIDREDEMSCLIKGCNFLLKNIPDEVFLYQRHGSPEYKFQGVDHNVFPYLLVNIGSGVSLVKVEAEDKFQRIGGTATGGGTFWGLGSLLTKAKTFDDLLLLAEKGDHRNVDMLVKDIYGGAYSKIGLPGDIIASSFGKAARLPRSNIQAEEHNFKEEDLARSLLLSISNDIGQIACLHAKLHNLKKIYFGGYFIRGHPLTMHTITYAINFWSKNEIQALFLRHEGYLGAIGAFLKGAEEEDADKYGWEENFAGSSGLDDCKPSSEMEKFDSNFDMLELDRLDKALLPCPLLLDPDGYQPDIVDLTQDAQAREYWLQCFVDSISREEEQAIKSQASIDVEDASHRAELFRDKYLQMLKNLKRNPYAYGSLNVRGLLDMRSHCLQAFDFTDPYSQQKQSENELALKHLESRLEYIDKIDNKDERILELAKGLLAGNVFDWGAKEVADIMAKGEFSFEEAQDKLQERPWLIDNFEQWRHQYSGTHPYKCAIIFCDNSGADIILGVFPFARDLLKAGTKVILCANSKPTLNDVTYQELMIITRRVSQICPLIGQASQDDHLVVMESGQGSPCLDLRLINYDLVNKIIAENADLVVIEGMGRAIHTNYTARFTCDSLKVAVLKNRWLAKRFGGDMFSVVFKFEHGAI